jgi:SAM-dependent methyltransferase
MGEAYQCPNCEVGELEIFHEVLGVPAHSVLLLNSREEALNFPKGDIRLGVCPNCGFISNVAFDPALNEYSARYEATQSFSPTFNVFAHNVATSLIERHNLREKTIIEIGCGQGEFLTMLCELGNNRGVGFDPAYRPHEIDSPAKGQLEFIADFYSEKYTDVPGDFVACKMTLEHIQPTAEFIRTVRRAVGGNPDRVIFFQIPNAMYVLDEVAFWDVYYEHVSYFTKGSVARLFRYAGFDVTHLATDYNDQYLMIEAQPRTGSAKPPLPEEDDLALIQRKVAEFKARLAGKLAQWRSVLEDVRTNNKRAVIWGGGSKGVAFLTTLGVTDEIPYAVDINPLKHGTFMAGTGQEIVAPEFLKEYQPDIVIVMNPIYCDEIQQDLDRLEVQAELIPL